MCVYAAFTCQNEVRFVMSAKGCVSLPVRRGRVHETKKRKKMSMKRKKAKGEESREFWKVYLTTLRARILHDSM